MSEMSEAKNSETETATSVGDPEMSGIKGINLNGKWPYRVALSHDEGWTVSSPLHVVDPPLRLRGNVTDLELKKALLRHCETSFEQVKALEREQQQENPNQRVCKRDKRDPNERYAG